MGSSRRLYGPSQAEMDNNAAQLQALRAAAAGGEGAARVFTPNAISTIAAAGYTPGTGGASILCAIAITAEVDGLVEVSASFKIVASAADTPLITLFGAAPLTSITGGTSIANPFSQGGAASIKGTPSATSPVPSAGTEIDQWGGATAVVGSANVASVRFVDTVTCVVGVPTLLAFVALSNSGSTTWTVTGNISALEQP